MGSTVSTDNFNFATALGTCGVQVDVDRQLDDVTGKRTCRFYLSDTNYPREKQIDQNAIANGTAQLAEHEETVADGKSHVLGGPLRFATARIVALVRDGLLPKQDPGHPLLDALRALNNREQLITYLKRGMPCRLGYVLGIPRMVYGPGGEPMVHKLGQPGVETWCTEDLKLVAAIALCGVPLVGVQRLDDGGHQMTLLRYGYELGGPPVDGVKLKDALLSGDLATKQPGHPVVWGYMTLKNRETLLDHINSQRELVLMRQPSSEGWRAHHRSALVEEDVKPAVLDRALRHLRRV